MELINIVSTTWTPLEQKTGTLVVRGNPVQLITSISQPADDELGIYVPTLHAPIPFDVINIDEKVWLKTTREGTTATAEVYPFFFGTVRASNHECPTSCVTEDDVRRMIEALVPPMVDSIVDAETGLIYSYIETIEELKANKSDVYTKSEIDTIINKILSRFPESYFTGTETNHYSDNSFKEYNCLLFGSGATMPPTSSLNGLVINVFNDLTPTGGKKSIYQHFFGTGGKVFYRIGTFTSGTGWSWTVPWIIINKVV